MTARVDRYDAIVLGAGAAGMMCAATAGQRAKRVLLADHADAPGKKILISGGGRCNFTNLHVEARCFLSENPHFAKSALGRYTQHDFLQLVESYRIAWHEKTLGQLFCDRSARQIVDLLLSECEKGRVKLALRQPVRAVTHADAMFRVELENLTAEAPSVVIATGGPSIPKMGASRFAYDLAQQFGLAIVTPRPALVPLTLGRDDVSFATVSGLSGEVIARTGKASFREACLFTHKGLSGPAILQISSYWKPGEPVAINFHPDSNPGWLIEVKARRPQASLAGALCQVVPNRLAAMLVERLAHKFPVDAGKMAEQPNRLLQAIEQQLSDWLFFPTGTEGFAKAEVTAGGIATGALSSKTMEAKDVPGLYSIGEAVDVTGWLGGYNFQWAWSSGWAAGTAIAAR